VPRRSVDAPTTSGDDETLWVNGFVPFFEDTAQRWRGIVAETDRDVVVMFGLLETLARAFRDVYARALAPFDLNHAEFNALGRLRTTPPGVRRSPTDLRRLLGQTSAGTTRVLAKLEDAGLVRREPDPDDGRGSFVVLTAKGRRIADRSFRAVHARQGELLASIKHPALAALETDLQQLVQALVQTP
jgi:DNA-binding MarR family transcriptional regulator